MTALPCIDAGAWTVELLPGLSAKLSFECSDFEVRGTDMAESSPHRFQADAVSR